MLLRDIIDLEATQGGPKDAAVRPAARAAAATARRAGRGGRRRRTPPSRTARRRRGGRGPGLSLSALEEKLKPEVLANFEEIEALYKKLLEGAEPPAGDA